MPLQKKHLPFPIRSGSACITQHPSVRIRILKCHYRESTCLFPIRSGSNLNSHSALVKQHHYNTHCYSMENLKCHYRESTCLFPIRSGSTCVNLNSHSALVKHHYNTHCYLVTVNVVLESTMCSYVEGHGGCSCQTIVVFDSMRQYMSRHKLDVTQHMGYCVQDYRLLDWT